MNLEYSAEYQQFRTEVRDFLAARWAPDASDGDDYSAATMIGGLRATEKQTKFRLEAIERGYLYRHVPRRWGGSEQPPDPLRAAIIGVRNETARIDPPNLAA